MYDLAVSGGSLDEDKLADYVMTHHDGRRHPPRPRTARHGERDHDRAPPRHPGHRASTYDHVIADTPPGFTAEVIATIDASSDLVMVGTLDSLSLKNTKLGLETLSLMDYDDAKIQLVLNRADTRVGISQHDVVSVLGREPDVYIPTARSARVNEGPDRPLFAAAAVVRGRPHSTTSQGCSSPSRSAPSPSPPARSSKRNSSLSFLRLKRR